MQICFRVGDFYDFGNPHMRDNSVPRFKINIVKCRQSNRKFHNKLQPKFYNSVYRRRTKISHLKNYYKVIIDTRNYHWMCRSRSSSSLYFLGLWILWSKWILSNQGLNRQRHRRFKSALALNKKQIDDLIVDANIFRV